MIIIRNTYGTLQPVRAYRVGRVIRHFELASAGSRAGATVALPRQQANRRSATGAPATATIMEEINSQADLSCQRIKLHCKRHLIFVCNDHLTFANFDSEKTAKKMTATARSLPAISRANSRQRNPDLFRSCCKKTSIGQSIHDRPDSRPFATMLQMAGICSKILICNCVANQI